LTIYGEIGRIQKLKNKPLVNQMIFKKGWAVFNGMNNEPLPACCAGGGFVY